MVKKRIESPQKLFTAKESEELSLKLDNLFKTLSVKEGIDQQDLVEQVRKEAEQEINNYNQDLRARAKNPEQLTVGLECTVLEVNYYHDSISFTPYSDMVFGGNSPSYSGGHVYRTEIRVNSGTLVEKLSFKGWIPLEAGDLLRAYITKGKKEFEKGELNFDSEYTPFQPAHFVERDYQPEECPSKIEKLRNGNVAATYNNDLKTTAK